MNEKNACTLPSGFVSPWALAGVPENVPVLVGFSGGADSMALLHMLYGICHKNGAPLYAVHVNHQIRGAEADRDEEFCLLTADSLGIPLFVCHRNVPELARKKGVGTEVAAREARYACFEALMAEKKIPLLAVAHHADDNLETMLFHMSRGSGLTGISGIPPSRPLKNGTLTRPLLRVPAEDIRSYCQAHGLAFVTDSTNSDTGYARNRLRAGAVPVLCAVNAGAVRNSARTAELLRRDDDCLSGIARQWLSDNRRENTLPCAALCEAHPAVASRAILLLCKESGLSPLPDAGQVDAVLALAKKCVPHSSLSLPGRICATVEDGKLLLLSEEKARQMCAVFSYEIPLSDGVNRISQTDCEIIMGNSQKSKNIYKKSILLYLASDKIMGTVTARNRRDGDAMKIGGMTKSLKKLFNEKKIPLDLRAKLPVLCDGAGVLAVPTVGVRDGASARDSAADGVICLQICFNEPDLNDFMQNRKG